MTRLMSFWTRPTVAAKNAVMAPTSITVIMATSEASNIGESRATMKTPAVTMVAAWMSADTGVGPSMASGSQVWSRNCADLPMAPMNSSRQTTVMAWKSQLRKWMTASLWPSTAWNASSKSSWPRTMKAAKMPSAKPKSPTRLTTNAFIAAALADGRVYQKPIRR